MLVQRGSTAAVLCFVAIINAWCLLVFHEDGRHDQAPTASIVSHSFIHYLPWAQVRKAGKSDATKICKVLETTRQGLCKGKDIPAWQRATSPSLMDIILSLYLWRCMFSNTVFLQHLLMVLDCLAGLDQPSKEGQSEAVKPWEGNLCSHGLQRFRW